MRTRLTVTIWALGLAFLGIALSRCGKKEGDKNAPVPPATTLPVDWDGQADWSGSAWEVVDE